MRSTDVFSPPPLADFVDLGCDLGAHWILKGVPKSTMFEENRKGNKKTKKEVPESQEKKHELLIDFRSEPPGPDVVNNHFGRRTVAKYEVRGVVKSDGKGHAKSDQNRPKNRGPGGSRSDLKVFGRF